MTRGFWIDAIGIGYSEDKKPSFFARAILDYESRYFFPYHSRIFEIAPDVVERALFNHFAQRLNFDRMPEGRDVMEVVQGGHYELNYQQAPEDMFTSKYVWGEDARTYITPTPFSSADLNFPVNKNLLMSVDELSDVSASGHADTAYLYCFNVGQGDSFLLISSSNQAYLIDTNIYSDDSCADFERYVNSILNSHGLNRVKALVVTHKHLDHLRGADVIIENGNLPIDSLLINLDYTHPTKSVMKLLQAAENRGLRFVNCCKEGFILAGDTVISIHNPTSYTATRDGSPDINDSSICLCVRLGSDTIAMTGDVSSDICAQSYVCSRLCKEKQRLLKVSHHGSITGTDPNIPLELLSGFSFISSGTSKKYQHPHNTVIEYITPKSFDLRVSKSTGFDLCYMLTGRGIHQYEVKKTNAGEFAARNLLRTIPSSKAGSNNYCFFMDKFQTTCGCLNSGSKV